MRRFHLWLIGIVFFAVPMVVAFYVAGLLRKAPHNGHPMLDPDLAVAIETARRSLPEFIAKLEKPPADAAAFVIKATFTDGGHAEMMWVDHLRYANGAFDGRLADTPEVVHDVRRGDTVHVAKADVVDWEIFYRTPNGVVHEGAETDRVLRRRQAGHALRYPARMPTSMTRLA